MKHKKYLSIILLLFSFVVQAQIKGSVQDSIGRVIQFCNVVLIKTADSSIVTGVTTDSIGKFQLNTSTVGNFRLLTYFIGYLKQYTSSFTITKAGQAYDAGVLILRSNPTLLKSVSVISNKPLIEQKIDRTVFNVENNVIFSGSNALEILKKLPSVSVDNNDNIKVAGKPGVLVIIDGKNTYMSAADLAQYLKSLDASQVQKIEVITNPSAKYDAAGSAVINVVLKKDKNFGFNAQLFSTFDQGIYSGNYNGINGNYRLKKWNFFGGLGFGYHDNISYQNITKTFNATAITPPQIFVVNSAPVNFMKNYNLRGGVDFTPNDKQTVSFNVRDGAGKFLENNNSTTSMSGIAIDSSLAMLGKQSGGWQYTNYDLSYDFKIDTSGRELTASADYSVYSNNTNEQDVAYYYNNDGQYLRPATELTSALLAAGNIWAAQADYSNPLGKNNKLEMGIKSSFVTTDNNGQYWNIINGVSVNDTTKSNHFIYKENIFAGYLNFYRKLSEKLELQIGLRGEESQINGIQLVHDASFTRNYFNLFPSAFFTYKMNKNNTFNFSYSRRIDRPDYGSLNPFRYYVDPYTYSVGNINLLPQYVDNFEVKYMYKTWLSTGVRYSYYNNVMAPLYTQIDSSHITYSMPSNIGYFDEVDFSTTANIPINKWLTTMITNDIYYNKYTGAILGGLYANTGYIWIPYVINTFTIKKGWSATATFEYDSRNLNGPSITEPFYIVAAGIRKQFAGNRGSIALNFSDILWSNKAKTSYIYQNVNVVELDHWDDRRIRLSINWKLGKSEYERENKKNAADDEINRSQKIK